ncbi:MAG TPA: DUF72 domain-containing protein [Gemmatimonadales bacterium]|nr:DUF72 domain-containing protein [Gemmatimonadales bacterium]
MVAPLCIGTAGWRLPKRHHHLFPTEGSHLERYAGRFPAVEINSSFYRPHRRATWERWGGSVPPSFRFSAKTPRTLTHDRRLTDPEPLLDEFLADVAGLGDRLGCLLVQMPPSLAFDARIAGRFFGAFRERCSVPIAAEPRHVTWFAPEAEALLVAHRVGRVAADPVCAPGADEPAGWPGTVYYRLHGSPRMYYSDYDAPYLQALAERLDRARQRADVAGPVWCIFDNTALDAATENAAAVLAILE